MRCTSGLSHKVRSSLCYAAHSIGSVVGGACFPTRANGERAKTHLLCRRICRLKRDNSSRPPGLICTRSLKMRDLIGGAARSLIKFSNCHAGRRSITWQQPAKTGLERWVFLHRPMTTWWQKNRLFRRQILQTCCARHRRLNIICRSMTRCDGFYGRALPGGARLKAIIQDRQRHWIAKFPAEGDIADMCAIEHASLRLAQACGISVPESRLVPVRGKNVLLVERFDRTP